jgi:hypothetical protein
MCAVRSELEANVAKQESQRQTWVWAVLGEVGDIVVLDVDGERGGLEREETEEVGGDLDTG